MSRLSVRFSLVLGLAVSACSVEASTTSSSSGGNPQTGPREAPELGTGDKSAASIDLVTIATDADTLKRPTGLAFNPKKPGELWVVNAGSNSFTIVHDATGEGRTAERRREAAMDHFLDRPMGIAFGADGTTFGSIGTFATCGESRNDHGGGRANDFMGPVLWTSDLNITGKKDPIGLGSHIDMLHSAPLCLGITHEKDNVYWAFAGQSGSIQRYNFQSDHNVGMDDHSDGIIDWFATGQFKRVEGIPAHLVFRAEDAMLYISDTGNGRVAKLNTKSGVKGKAAPKKEELAGTNYYDNAEVTDFVSADRALVAQPSGIAIKGNYVYVADASNGRISAFNMKGELVNHVDTGLAEGTVGGITFGPDNKLYLVDMVSHRVLRVDPKPAAK